LAERIYIGADHAGYDLKQKLVAELRRLGYEPVDVGPATLDPQDDYPDFAKRVAEPVSRGEVRRGVLTCGTGVGMGMAANRYANVRAAVVWNPEVAELSRKHNDANVLVLPARAIDETAALAALRRWLDTAFEGGRHARRVDKIEVAPDA
jgi:ribose 5-phosphate isomerase B